MEKKIVVQNIILPNEVCDELQMYFRANQEIDITDGCIDLERDTNINTLTYMNLFDASFWRKHTGIQKWFAEMTVKGKGFVALYCKFDDKRKLITKQKINTKEEEKICFPFQCSGKNEQYYLEIHAEEKLTIKNGCYFTVPDKRCRKIHLGIVICTYKRKEDLYFTLSQLQKSRFFDEKDYLYGKMTVRIADNASELSPSNHPYISIYPNPNTGGSGGFTRGIVETRKEAEKYGITNVVLMDDDVKVIPETFYRLYALLSLIEEEYQDEVIAGRMFRLEQCSIQYTAIDIWNKGYIQHVGGDLDMTKEPSIINVNDSENGEYSGWWFACFPMKFIKENTPLPFFLHCDDVEYGLRHGGRPIILNGIQIWHESFENRLSPVTEYYDIRNTLILNTILYPFDKKEEVYKWWKSRISERHLQNRYLAEYMMILGMLDYLKGKGHLETQNSENINKKLRKKIKANRFVNSFLWRYTKCIFNYKYKKAKETYKGYIH